MEARGRKGARAALAAGLALVVTWTAACSPRQIHEDPVIRQGDRVPDAEARVEEERYDAEQVAARRAQWSDAIQAEALATCEPELCDAVVRGEVALGMTEVQVMAATRTTESAWRMRRSGPAAVLTPRSIEDPPRDLVADLARVQLVDGRVAAFSYREPTGYRLVSSPEDATGQGRAQALAQALIREGDDYAARGDLRRALDRYDRADVLSDEPILDYKIGAVLDKQLRPIEALIQYRLFLHRLELERIEARGRAAGHLADAIAQARQRVLILERQGR